METFQLTRDAYDVLIRKSGEVSDYLRSDIAVSAQDFPGEEAYLAAMYEAVVEIARDPFDYLDEWNLLEEIDSERFGEKTAQYAEQIRCVMQTPIEKRGPVDE